MVVSEERAWRLLLPRAHTVISGKGNLGKYLLEAVDYFDLRLEGGLSQATPEVLDQLCRRDPAFDARVFSLLFDFAPDGQLGTFPHLTIRSRKQRSTTVITSCESRLGKSGC